MAHRSKRKHVKHEHVSGMHPVQPEPIGGELPPGASIPRIVAELALAIARRVVRRALAPPRRMLDTARDAWARRHAEAR